MNGYPELAIRELVGNMLIHQDLTLRGGGPLVEVLMIVLNFLIQVHP